MSKTVKIKPFIMLIALFSVALLAHIYGICINITPSMPEGIYRRDDGKVHRGDEVRLSNRFIAVS